MLKKTKLAFTKASIEHKLPDESTLKDQVAYYKHNPKFCFKCLDLNKTDFNIDKFNKSREFRRLFEGLRDMSPLTWGEIARDDFWHAHPVEWKISGHETAFKKVTDKPAFQFKSFSCCRVLGFFDSQAIFHVVWFDRTHEAAPRKH